MTPRIAVLDDEPRMAEVLSMVLRRAGHDVTTFNRPTVALQALEEHGFDLLLTDLKMPEMDGVEVLQRARSIDPELPIILVTAHATVDSAIAAMRAGAFDYIQKPFDNTETRALVARALEMTRLTRENRYLRTQLREQHRFDQIVAVSEAMQAVLDLCRRAARGRATVLVTGESGTGKELVARAIHFHSDRVGAPFVAVNCTAFSAGVLESELFGHEKGAFTGAAAARQGVFERAHGGTLFLDEIGEIDAAFQAKLLRVLQEGEVQRVGADRPRAVDVRVVTATNRDLRAEVAEERFREDLYFRLAVIPIHLPPLRERPDDVVPLATHFLRQLDPERRLQGWSDEVEAWMVGHSWPGNVRELENTLQRGVVLAQGDHIELADLVLPGSSAPTSGGTLQQAMDAAAAERIRAALREAGGVRVDAAERLGVERTTLYRLMKKYGL